MFLKPLKMVFGSSKENYIFTCYPVYLLSILTLNLEKESDKNICFFKKRNVPSLLNDPHVYIYIYIYTSKWVGRK